MEGVGRQIDAGRQGAKRVRKEEFVQDTCRWKGGGGTLDPGTANNHRSAIGADEGAKTSGGGGGRRGRHQRCHQTEAATRAEILPAGGKGWWEQRLGAAYRIQMEDGL